jgi:hypothetical protein
LKGRKIAIRGSVRQAPRAGVIILAGQLRRSGVTRAGGGRVPDSARAKRIGARGGAAFRRIDNTVLICEGPNLHFSSAIQNYIFRRKRVWAPPADPRFGPGMAVRLVLLAESCADDDRSRHPKNGSFFCRRGQSVVRPGIQVSANTPTPRTAKTDKRPSVSFVSDQHSRCHGEPELGHPPHAYEERAAHLEYDAGLPRTWAEQFARLLCSRPPGDFDAVRRRRIVDGGLKFADQWAPRPIGLAGRPTMYSGCTLQHPPPGTTVLVAWLCAG